MALEGTASMVVCQACGVFFSGAFRPRIRKPNGDPYVECPVCNTPHVLGEGKSLQRKPEKRGGPDDEGDSYRKVNVESTDVIPPPKRLASPDKKKR